jgi:hypothetical protein
MDRRKSWETSLVHVVARLTRRIVIGSGRKKSAALSFRAIWIAATLPTWLKNREINALKSP